LVVLNGSNYAATEVMAGAYGHRRTSRPGGLMAVESSKQWPSAVVFGLFGGIAVLLCTTVWQCYANKGLHEHVAYLDHNLHQMESKAHSLQVTLDASQQQSVRDAALREQHYNESDEHIKQLEIHVDSLHEENADLTRKLTLALQEHAETKAAAVGSGATATELSQCLQDYRSMQVQYATATQNVQAAETKAAMWKRHYDDEVANHARTAASLNAATTRENPPHPIPPPSQPAVTPPVPPAVPPTPHPNLIPPPPPMQPSPSPPQPVVPPAQHAVPGPVHPSQYPTPQPNLIPPVPPIQASPPQHQPGPLPTPAPAGHGPSAQPQADKQYVVDETFV
jgi:hypothetical protein